MSILLAESMEDISEMVNGVHKSLTIIYVKFAATTNRRHTYTNIETNKKMIKTQILLYLM